MRDLPFASLRKELVFRHLDAMTGCQCLDDRVEFLAVWCTEVDTNAKTIYQRKFFLYGIRGVDIVTISNFQFVPCSFTDKVTTVAGRIDQDVVRLRSRPPSITAFRYLYSISNSSKERSSI